MGQPVAMLSTIAVEMILEFVRSSDPDTREVLNDVLRLELGDERATLKLAEIDAIAGLDAKLTEKFFNLHLMSSVAPHRVFFLSTEEAFKAIVEDMSLAEDWAVELDNDFDDAYGLNDYYDAEEDEG